VPCTIVKTWPEAASDIHFKAREMIVTMKQPFVGKIEAYGSPFKMSETSAKVRGYAPLIGEHNKEILSSTLGYTDREISSLYKENILYEEEAVGRLPEELRRLSELD
jgi:CoA:oxalate CoA-transferase